MKDFGQTRNSELDYGCDLLSDLDAGILFLLCLFTICNMVLVYHCLLGVSTIMLMILVKSLISIL